MRKTLLLALIVFISFSFAVAVTNDGVTIDTRCPLQDTVFIKNYVIRNSNSYLYIKPNLKAKSKVRIPTNVTITTINKSGNFEYGNFNVSSNKSYRGWFLVTDLNGITFSPPKITKKKS